ncbi:hypothetical protein [Streptomyces sp. G1]|uniref:hypothetical protein n=1 Tax=Streptomyces sp. G1 TaxID=361572 RepID=UPI00203090D3|nr:hypothetical protein [Streptomyces sp. G1]MCM1965908.1 hypothetical protein [Streptomyces sp. G1]
MSPSPEAATALIWAQVTQGDYLHSPDLTALRNFGRDTTHLVASANQLLAGSGGRGDKAQLAKRLDDYAKRLAIACDRSPEFGTAPEPSLEAT